MIEASCHCGAVRLEIDSPPAEVTDCHCSICRRYRIDTVFSQLSGRYSLKRVWAKDLWHLAGRLLRKVLSHTVAFLLNHRAGNRPLQLSELLY
jgi:hypothetical protein